MLLLPMFLCSSLELFWFVLFKNCFLIVGQEAIREAEAEAGIVEIGQEVEVVPTTVTRVVGKFL